jgi:hypothetical protein
MKLPRSEANLPHPKSRRKPYTAIGIRRLKCFRCGARAEFQWQVCADGNQYRPLCRDCDVGLNALVLRWMRHPEAERLTAAYIARVNG